MNIVVVIGNIFLTTDACDKICRAYGFARSKIYIFVNINKKIEIKTTTVM